MSNSSAPRWPRARRSAKRLLGITAGILAAGGVLAANMPTVGVTMENWYHHYQITRPAYEAKYGQWTQL